MGWIGPAIQIGGSLLAAYMQHQQQAKDAKSTKGFDDFMNDLIAAHGRQQPSNIGFNTGGGVPQNSFGGGVGVSNPYSASGSMIPGGAGNTGLSQSAILQYFQNMRNQPSSLSANQFNQRGY